LTVIAIDGLALVVVRAKPGVPGAISLHAQSGSLGGATVALKGVAAR